MKSYLIVLSCFICISLFSQETWITNIKTPIFERVFDIREIPNGNYLAVGRRDLDSGPQNYAFFVELSKEGEIVNQQDIIIPDSSISLHQFISISDTSFVMVGKIESDIDGNNDLWMAHFNYDFEIIKQNKLHCFPGYTFGDFRAKFITNGNLLINGFVGDTTSNPWDIFFYETNLGGDSISSALINLPYSQFSWEFIERKDGQGYYVYGFGNFLVNPPPPGLSALVSFDTNFTYTSVDSVPGLISNIMNTLWLTDNSYLLSGNKNRHNPPYATMGIIKLNAADQIINEYSFGLMPDTNTYAGSSDHIDFLNPDTIFFSGTGNFANYPYQSEPSWIIVNCLDSNLNLRWQTLYGGDAFYHSWEVYATSDGGCIVAASKYDYTLPDYDYDVVLLKFNNTGLLTSIPETEEIPLSMSVYPNPGVDMIKINNDFEDAVFQLFDESGRMMKTSTLDIGLNQLNVNEINPGIYVYKVFIKQKPVSSGKWIKR